MDIIPRYLRPIALFLLLCCLAGVAVSFCGTTSNCGGNSAALAQVGQITLCTYLGASETADHSFRFAEAQPEYQAELAKLSRTHWLRRARFLVCTAPVTEQAIKSHRMVVVCDTPYRNVPEHRFWSAPPTHAVGFADGSKGLISTADFAALDRSAFVPLDEIWPSAPSH